MNPVRAQRMGMSHPGSQGAPPMQSVSGAPPSRSQREREKLTGMVAPGHPSYRAPPPQQQPPPANGFGQRQPPTPDQSQHPGYRQPYGQPPQGMPQPQHAPGRPYGAVPAPAMQQPPTMQAPVNPQPQHAPGRPYG